MCILGSNAKPVQSQDGWLSQTKELKETPRERDIQGKEKTKDGENVLFIYTTCSLHKRFRDSVQ